MSTGNAISTATEAALRASIARFGVIVPVVVDQHGTLLDGHNRARIAQEMGCTVPTQVREVADEHEAQEIARTLNEDRRHMPRKERQEVVRALRAEGHSTRAIAKAVGVSQALVVLDMKPTEQDYSVEIPGPIIGLNGKRYATTRAKNKPGPKPVDQMDKTSEWMRLRRLGETQVAAGKASGMNPHHVRRIIEKHGDPLPLIGGMNAYEMLDAQTRQLDFAADIIGQIIAAIDPAHAGVPPFLLALRKLRAASDTAERALRRATIKVI